MQLCSNANSTILRNTSTRIASLIAKPVIREMIEWDKTKKLPYRLIIHFGDYMRRQYKQEALELVNILARWMHIAAWQLHAGDIIFVSQHLKKAASRL